MILWRVLVVVAVTVVPGCELSTDPVSETCEPLCQYELEAERLCAVQKGCYEQHIVNNDVLFIQVHKEFDIETKEISLVCPLLARRSFAPYVSPHCFVPVSQCISLIV